MTMNLLRDFLKTYGKELITDETLICVGKLVDATAFVKQNPGSSEITTPGMTEKHFLLLGKQQVRFAERQIAREKLLKEAVKAGEKGIEQDIEYISAHLNHKDLLVPGDFRESYLQGDDVEKSNISKLYSVFNIASFIRAVEDFLGIDKEPNANKRKELSKVLSDATDMGKVHIEATFRIGNNIHYLMDRIPEPKENSFVAKLEAERATTKQLKGSQR